MSIHLVNAAFLTSIPTTEKIVLLALCHCHNDETKKCNPMVKTLMEMTGLSHTSIAKALKFLQAEGYLEIHRKQGNRGCYVITSPEHWTKTRNQQALEPKEVLKETKKNEVTGLGSKGDLDPEVKIVDFRSKGDLFQNSTSLISEVKEIDFSIIEQEKNSKRTGIEHNSFSRKKENQVTEIEEVFSHWKVVMNSPKSKLDDKRRRIIRNALKQYTANELKRAIEGCYLDPWSMGDNDRHTKFNGINIILRDAEHIDKFIALYERPPKPKETGTFSEYFSNQRRVIDECPVLLG